MQPTINSMAKCDSDIIIETENETECLLNPRVSVVSAGNRVRTPAVVVLSVTVNEDGDDVAQTSTRPTGTRVSPRFSTQTVDGER